MRIFVIGENGPFSPALVLNAVEMCLILTEAVVRQVFQKMKPCLIAPASSEMDFLLFLSLSLTAQRANRSLAICFAAWHLQPDPLAYHYTYPDQIGQSANNPALLQVGTLVESDVQHLQPLVV